MTDYHKLTRAQLIKELNRLQADKEMLKSSEDAKNLYHDLEVYQVELEMQNRELRDKQLELELARDRYADLYEFAPVGYLTLDDKGIIRDINLTATGLLGYNRNQLLGKPFSVFLSNGDSRDFFHALRTVIVAGDEQSLELLLKRKDDSNFHVQLQMIPPMNNNAEIRVALIDISEQKAAESEARENREALLHADRLSLLGELSSGIAHEVSQPITAIGIYAEMLRDLANAEQLAKSDLVEIAEQVSAQSERAGLILDRVRSFARREELRQMRQSILDVIDEAVGFVKPIIKQNDVSVVVRKQGKIRDVKIDRVQIIQVIVNLLHNAIEAMRDTPSQQREIVIEVSMVDEKYVEVAVVDNGIGIRQEVRDQVFMPFYTTRAKGLGLGLSLSHSVIQAHGGRMWAEPNKQQGTIFRFTLPLPAIESQKRIQSSGTS
jgi:PAS domain S-box-containing protein